jgi:hypothetical protein
MHAYMIIYQKDIKFHRTNLGSNIFEQVAVLSRLRQIRSDLQERFHDFPYDIRVAQQALAFEFFYRGRGQFGL